MATHERAALTALLMTPGAGRAAAYDALAAAQAARAPLHELLGLPARRLIERLPPGQNETAALIARCSPAHRNRAETLLERETLEGKDLDALMRGEDLPPLPTLSDEDAEAPATAEKEPRKGIGGIGDPEPMPS